MQSQQLRSGVITAIRKGFQEIIQLREFQMAVLWRNIDYMIFNPRDRMNADDLLELHQPVEGPGHRILPHLDVCGFQPG